MFLFDEFKLEEHLHNLINLHIYPERPLRLGQHVDFKFKDATVTIERVGNLFATGRHYAVTYRYNIEGDGFRLCLLAIWEDEDQATAEVKLLSIRPDDEETRETILAWLLTAVTGRGKPSFELGAFII